MRDAQSLSRKTLPGVRLIFQPASPAAKFCGEDPTPCYTVTQDRELALHHQGAAPGLPLTLSWRVGGLARGGAGSWWVWGKQIWGAGVVHESKTPFGELWVANGGPDKCPVVLGSYHEWEVVTALCNTAMFAKRGSRIRSHLLGLPCVQGMEPKPWPHTSTDRPSL